MPFFIHCYTGDFVRRQFENQPVEREAGYVKTYEHLGRVTDAYEMQVFNEMLESGQKVMTTGAHIFQIRN